MADVKAIFTIEFDAKPAAKLQWYIGDGAPETRTPLEGAVNSTLSIANITKSMNGNSYSCLVKNFKGEVWSDLAVLTVYFKPEIVNNPNSQIKSPGDTLNLTVFANPGNPPETTYQWFRNSAPLSNGGNISGADTSSLVITNYTDGVDSGDYYVVVSNSIGEVTSDIATITTEIIPPPPGGCEPCNTCETCPVGDRYMYDDGGSENNPFWNYAGNTIEIGADGYVLSPGGVSGSISKLNVGSDGYVIDADMKYFEHAENFDGLPAFGEGTFQSLAEISDGVLVAGVALKQEVNEFENGIYRQVRYYFGTVGDPTAYYENTSTYEAIDFPTELTPNFGRFRLIQDGSKVAFCLDGITVPLGTEPTHTLSDDFVINLGRFDNGFNQSMFGYAKNLRFVSTNNFPDPSTLPFRCSSSWTDLDENWAAFNGLWVTDGFVDYNPFRNGSASPHPNTIHFPTFVPNTQFITVETTFSCSSGDSEGSPEELQFARMQASFSYGAGAEDRGFSAFIGFDGDLNVIITADGLIPFSFPTGEQFSSSEHTVRYLVYPDHVEFYIDGDLKGSVATDIDSFDGFGVSAMSDPGTDRAGAIIHTIVRRDDI